VAPGAQKRNLGLIGLPFQIPAAFALEIAPDGLYVMDVFMDQDALPVIRPRLGVVAPIFREIHDPGLVVIDRDDITACLGILATCEELHFASGRLHYIRGHAGEIDARASGQDEEEGADCENRAHHVPIPRTAIAMPTQAASHASQMCAVY